MTCFLQFLPPETCRAVSSTVRSLIDFATVPPPSSPEEFGGESNDATQDTLKWAWEDAHFWKLVDVYRADGPIGVRRYLATAVRHRQLDIHRRAKSSPIAGCGLETLGDTTPGPILDPAEIAESREQAELILDFLDSLDPMRRDLLLSTESAVTLAARHGLATGTVYKYRTRMREKIKALLAR